MQRNRGEEFCYVQQRFGRPGVLDSSETRGIEAVTEPGTNLVVMASRFVVITRRAPAAHTPYVAGSSLRFHEFLATASSLMILRLIQDVSVQGTIQWQSAGQWSDPGLGAAHRKPGRMFTTGPA